MSNPKPPTPPPGLPTPPGLDHESMIALASTVVRSNAEPMPARYGTLGNCAACKDSIVSHFDTAGRWIGCTQVSEGTVFSLYPMPSPRASVRGHHNGVSESARGNHHRSTVRREREFIRARYVSLVPKGKRLDSLTLNSEHRQKVLQAIHTAGKVGMLARDIIEKADLPHGSVQQALSWLRKHEFVDAREDALDNGTTNE